MHEANTIGKLAIIGNDVPRQCGIATFTHDMYASLSSAYPEVDVSVVAVNDRAGGYAYGPEVRFEFDEGDLDGYLRAAEFLNFQCPDVVNVQHEFGIYGGAAGWYINALVRELQAPVVTTLHTVLKTPNPDQRRSLKRLCDLSAKVVVMSETGKRLLRESCRVPESKIEVVAHGIPDMPFTDPSYFKDRFKAEGKFVLLTFGLLAPNKGIEHMLKALPRVVAEFPELVYLVVGATHPNLIRDNGESYRESLQQLARDLGVEKNVEFANKFVDREELLEYIGASDLYITPYLNPAQITSGTLAYSFGCGKAVISTPYWHAEELLADGRGVLVPFADPDALSNEIVALLRDEPRRQAMRKRAYVMGREMIWSQSARNYMDVFVKARSSLSERPASMGRARSRFPADLPEWRFDHLLRLSDSTGMIQHAVFTLPNYSEGYCTDDNARALMLTAMLEDQGVGEEVVGVASRYAAFLEHAFNPEQGRFRNFLGFDRRWLEDVGSEDSHGRAVWALGTCVGRSQRKGLQQWAVLTFEKALGASLDMAAPRSWAFTLLGLHEYLRRLRGARKASLARDVLVGRLVQMYDETATADWPWFEDKLSYDNARIPQALIVGGRECSHPRALEIGLTSLRWLTTLQKGTAGHFRAIGSNGFYTRGEEPARFDQQPLEASATVSACLSAYAVTDDRTWLTEALTAFEWFLGRNDLNLPLYDPATGGCRDGLEPDRVNQNQGAESTLAFLLAMAELKAIYQPYGGPARSASSADVAAPALRNPFPSEEMLR